MSVRRQVRRGLIALTAVVVAALVPTAAYAAPPALVLTVHDGGVPEAGKWFDLSLSAKDGSSSWRLDHSKLVVDTSEIADFATAWVPNFDEDGEPYPAKYCSSAGSVLTCDLGTTYSWGLPYLVVEAKKGAEPGRSGRITVKVTGDGIDPLVATPKITVADDVDLAVAVAETVVTGRPGQPISPPVLVTNNGDKPVDGAALRLVGYSGLQRFNNYTNCGYDKGDQQMYCRFDTVLAPGATYQLEGRPLAIRGNATPGEAAGYAAILFTGDDFDETGIMSALTKGTEGVLCLVPRPSALRVPTTDSNGENNIAFGHVDVFDVPGGGPSSPPSTPPGGGSAGSGQHGGGLPVTGLPTGAIAGAGAGLLVLGGVGFLLARRRRARFVA